MRGRPEEMEDDTRQILQELCRSWRLRSLALDLGEREWGSRYQGPEAAALSLLEDVAALLGDCPSLRALRVLHWPHGYVSHEEGLHLAQVGEVLSNLVSVFGVCVGWVGVVVCVCV